MEDKIILKNKRLADYVMFKLDEIDNEFNQEELDKIIEVVINLNEVDDRSILFKELSYFRNLKELSFYDGIIFNNDFEYLLNMNKLNSITLVKCDIENADLLATLKLNSLSLVNCKINNYDFIYLMQELVNLSIVSGSINIEKLNRLSKLRILEISYSNISGDILKIDLKTIEELYIDNTNITDLYFVSKLNKLNTLSVDDMQILENKYLIMELIKRDISVLNENMVEVGDIDE